MRGVMCQFKGSLLGMRYVLIFAMILTANEATACSVLDLEAFVRANLIKARWYWLGGGIIAITILILHFKRTKAWLIPAFVLLAVGLHPAWTVTPFHGPDCVSLSVFSSRIVIVVLLMLLMYEGVRYAAYRRKTSGGAHNQSLKSGTPQSGAP